MRFEDIMSRIKNIEKNKIDIAREFYLKEIELDNRPAYYEKLVFKNFIEWLDSKVIETIGKNYELYVLVKDNNKSKEIKELYPDSKIISLSSIIPFEDYEIISEYIGIQRYQNSLFRLLYRHIYNDKENFHIKKDNVKKGYIVFEIKTLTDNIYNFKNRYKNKKYIRVNKNINENLNKIEYLCKKYETFNNTEEIIEDIIDEQYYKSYMSKATKAEIELYNRFMIELDFFVLSRNIIYNTDKLYVFKNYEDRKSSNIPGINKIVIEDILNESIKDTDINSILNIEKYIYPCWRIACEHFYNQGMNYNVLEDEDKYIKIKSFL